MAHREPTVRTTFAASMLAVLANGGRSEAAAQASAGFNGVALDDPETRIPLSNYLVLLKQIQESSGDPYFSIRVGLGMSLRELGILGYVMSNSLTIRQAFKSLGRYWRLEMEGSSVGVEMGGGSGIFTYKITGATPEEARPEIEGAVGYAIAIMRELHSPGWKPDEVHLQHATTHHRATLEGLIGAPVYVGQTETRMVFAASHLDHPIERADPVLLPILRRHAEDMLGAMPAEGDLVGEVRQHIADALRNGNPTINAVAKKLAMSQRTLQRRLSEADMSFANLVDQIRYDLSQRYFKEPSLAVTEIAFLLGYSEVSAFNRACQRWTGQSPTDCRRAILDQAHT